MNQALYFGRGTGTRLNSRGTALSASERSDSPKESVTATLICHFARAMLSKPLEGRSTWRWLILSALKKARATERFQCIDKMLHVFVPEGGPFGLDIAIDILAQTETLILDYAKEYLLGDITRWGFSSERSFQPNDDYWYVLLRAVARANVPEKDRLRLISRCANAPSRGVREGVVEALRDLGAISADKLRKFASEDKDAFIRKLAHEALEDLES